MDRARAAAIVVSIALAGATLSPLVRSDPYDDGFPLSTYPMFASKRPQTWTMHYALGEGRAGERHVLTPEHVGTSEVMQAMRSIERAVSGGRVELVRLCDAIASRVAADPDYRDVLAIRIVTGTHHAIDYLARGRIGQERERHRCEVSR